MKDEITTKVISLIHNAKYSGMPTHYPSIVCWNLYKNNFNIYKILKEYFSKKVSEDIGIYINIPFCKTKCRFCFLDVVCSPDKQEEYVNSLIREFEIFSKMGVSKFPIKSVYIGGGTPNILSSKNLEKILKNLHRYFNLKKCEQISIESSPDFWDAEKIRVLDENGVNFIMIGVQSFNSVVSQKNNRYQKLINFEKSIELIKRKRIKINIDLLIGIYETEKIFFNDLRKILKIMPNQVHLNRIKPIYGSLDVQKKRYLIELQNKGFEYLSSFGYKRIDDDSCSLGNFGGNIQGKSNFQIFSTIIPLGSGSMGHILGKMRYQNATDVDLYIKRLHNGEIPVSKYAFLNIKDEVDHYCLNKVFGTGIDLEDIYKKFNKKTFIYALEKINNLYNSGKLEKMGNIYKSSENWFEITKAFYNEKYIHKIAKAYKL